MVACNLPPGSGSQNAEDATGRPAGFNTQSCYFPAPMLPPGGHLMNLLFAQVQPPSSEHSPVFLPILRRFEQAEQQAAGKEENL